MSQQLLRRAWNFIDTIKQVYPEHWSPEEQVLLDDLMKADLDQSPDYERGFIDGMQKQMQSSVDKTVNAMSRQAEKQEPWQWNDAPIKTQWGQDMVVADLEIDKDHTVSVYCERDQTKNVEAMFTPQPQREWVGLTDEERREAWLSREAQTPTTFAKDIEQALKEKNGC